MNILNLLLLVPIIGSVIILFIPENGITKNVEQMKKIALITSLLNLIIFIYLWVQFDSSTSQYQFVSEFKELNIVFIQFITILGVLVLSMLIVYNSNRGYLGISLRNFCNYNSLSELFILIFMIGGILMLQIELLTYIVNNLISDIRIDYFNMDAGNNNNPNNTQDPVRQWPSGSPQTWGIIGSALAVYRVIPGSHKVKSMAALAAIGIAIPATTYYHAVENPNGFNRLMYSWMTYKQTGKWPANIPNKVEDTQLDPILANVVAEAENSNVPTNGNSLIGNDFVLSDFIPNNLFKYILDLFAPVPVEGYLDDLIGQQLFIHFLLLMIVVSLIIFLSIFMFIQILLKNKDYITKRFNNRFVLLYIKYQFILAKISFILLPLIIMFGLLELFIGLYFIITHPIPYDKIPTDLHIYINK